MKIHIYKYSFFLLFLLLIAAGCEKEYENIETLDERNIQEYIQRNGLRMTQYDTTGIYYQVTTVPSEDADTLDYTQQLPVIYTVRSLDGAFSSEDTIKNHFGNFFGYFTPSALRDITKKMLVRQGGTIRIIVPSRKAYGRNGSSSLGIPGNASLDYTIKVLEKKKLPDYEDQMIRKHVGSDISGYTKSPEGIYYKINDPGTGSPIGLDSVVTVNFSGSLMNGQVFQTLEGYSSTVDGFINAWKKILPLVKEGGSLRLLTPSTSAYGIVGSSSIPAFSPLDFTITVTDVAK